MRLVRWLVAVGGGLALAAVLSGTAFADGPAAPATVAINGGAPFTNNALVTVALSFPTDDSGSMRLSSDGSTWTAPLPWQQTAAWDVTDPSTGGSSNDGHKTVYVEYQNGSGWSAPASATIVLDRTPPQVGPINVLCGYTGGWTTPSPCFGWMVDNGSGFALNEFKLDNGPWVPVSEIWPGGFDFRTLLWGGSWTTDNRQVCHRVTDGAGNVSEPSCATYNLSIPPITTAGSATLYDVRFEFPKPAVTGQLFTIRPVYPQNFPTLPASATCSWILRWGDAGMLRELPNEDYGSVWVTHTFGDGGCNEWTFTLPYTPGLHYEFDFSVTPDWRGSSGVADVYQGTGDMNLTEFAATVGTYERGIPESTMGLAYLVPDEFETQPGDPVTYHVYASHTPGWQLPAKAYWWAVGGECDHLMGGNDPTAARTWTYTPDCQGPWETGWTWENWDSHEYLRAEFDPPADKTAPKVTGLQALARPGATLAGGVPATISWQSVDPLVRKVSTGVARNQLQVSRNGGKWTNVALSSPTSTSGLVNLQVTGKYRFRVRSFDNVGNVSAWLTGATFKPRAVQETGGTLGSGWSRTSAPGLSGGASVTSSHAGATASLAFTGRAISWIGSTGPGSGLAQVYLDGALVRTVDLASASLHNQAVLFSSGWTSAAKHTLKIVVLGTFGRPAVSIDAFVVLK